MGKRGDQRGERGVSKKEQDSIALVGKVLWEKKKKLSDVAHAISGQSWNVLAGFKD